MSKTQSLDSELAQYSIAARAVLDLKKPAKRLGELALYTAAASSALALAPGAEASIIYSGIKNITVHRVTNGSSSASVDLNRNGQGDFSFGIRSSHAVAGGQTDSAAAYGYPGSFLGSYGSARFFDNNRRSLLKLAASSRNIGTNYGPNTSLKYIGGMRGHTATASGSNIYGLWNPGPGASSTGFAGVRIGSANTTAQQFGWLHFKLTTDSANRTDSLTLIDWAFQSVSGASIHVGDRGTTPVPEPSTLGLMALGAAGIAALRRRRSHEKKADRVH